MSGVTLVTGGGGYVGTHTVKDFLDNTTDRVVILDSFERSDQSFAEKLRVKYGDRLTIRKVELEDKDAVSHVMKNELITDVVHCAAYINVPEGQKPENNDLYQQKILANTENLLEAMKENNVKRLVFSSSAATYGSPIPEAVDEKKRITEKHPQKPSTVYGKYKLECERIMRKAVENNDLDSSIFFRYFNVAGADPEGLIGEAHLPDEIHMLPLIILTALGVKDKFTIFGNELDTRDGTPVRDLIHVLDLGEAHRTGIERMRSGTLKGVNEYNLGIGEGVTVREAVDTVKEILGDFKVRETKELRSEGEPEILCASSSKARAELDWHPKYTLKDIVSTAIDWHRKLVESGWYKEHGIGKPKVYRS